MIVTMEPATVADIDEMSPRVRSADKAELWAAYLQTPSQVLHDAIIVSPNAVTGRINGEIVCIFGVAETSTLTPDHGRPWMVATTNLDIKANAKPFLRRNRAWLLRMLERYTMLSNYCDARNVQTLKWLAFLGFTFTDTEPMGPLLLPFVRFEMRRDGTSL